MEKYKVYISIILILISALVGINLLLDDNHIEVDAVAASIGDIFVMDETTTTATTTTSTTTTTTTTTSNPTTKVPVTTTTKKAVDMNNTLTISNSNKIFKLKKDDGTGNIISNGNSYGMIDKRLTFDSRKMIIYGHSFVGGGGYFNYFQNYDNNKSFYDNHKYITVNYNGKEYKYEIFSVYIVTANSDDDPNMEYYNWYNYNNVMWETRIKEYKNKSQYNTGVDVEWNDKILIIQTCSTNSQYANKYYISNLVIMGKLLKGE